MAVSITIEEPAQETTAVITDSEIQITPITITAKDHRATRTTEASEIKVAVIRILRELRITKAVVVSEIHNSIIKTKTVPDLRNHPMAGSEEVQVLQPILSRTAVLQDNSQAEADLDKTIINKKTDS